MTKSIGQILIEMCACSREQVDTAANRQREDAEDRRIGVYLVAMGFVSDKQLEVALKAQEGLRSSKRYKQAEAMAEIAEAASVANIAHARAVRQKSGQLSRSVTGQGHPAVKPAVVPSKH